MIGSTSAATRRISAKRALLPACAGALVLLLPVVFHLDGKQHGPWLQLFGRLHPLAVHLPIGLLVLLPLLEWGGRRRPALREAAGLVLALSGAACLVAVCLGYSLAYGGGVAGSVVKRHMWGGVALTILVLLAIPSRSRWSAPAAGREAYPRLYPALLLCISCVLAWAAHQGGTLTHGANYLTEFLPAPLQRWTAGGVAQAAAKAAGSSVYAVAVHPVLDARCVACHGESKVSGGLRLDTYEALMRGGQHGPVITPGQPDKSLMLERVNLPREHKEFMPAEGRQPLTSSEIQLLRAWIQAGASASASQVAGAPVSRPSETLPPVGDYSARQAQIAALNAQPGPKLLRVSRNPQDGLVLLTVDSAASFDDAALQSFAPFAPYIVEADLARTAVTDRCFETLAQFPHLRVVHLESTHVTGRGLDKLASLPELRYLNLSDTGVTAEAANALKGKNTLERLYLFNTPAQPSADTPQTTRQALGGS